MHSELGRSLWLLLLLLLTQTIAVHGTDCVIENDSGTVRYDLRALERQGGYDVDGYDTDYTFKLNVCASLSDPHEPSAAGAGRWFRGEHSGTLGSLGAKPQLRGEKLVLEYAGGDTCPGAPQLNQSALISFICDSRTDGRPEFVAEWAGCAFMFEWRTRAACGSTVLASNDQHVEADEGGADQPGGVSRGSVAFVVVFVVGSIYILGGFLYNRVLNTSSRLRGFEQLPNYQFWRGIYLGGKWLVTGVANGMFYLVDAVSGRRGAIRIDDAEYSIRNELFHSDDEGQEILPIRQRA